MLSGMNEDEARSVADKEYWKSLISDALGGFFGGLTSGAATNIRGVVANYGDARRNGKVTKSIGSEFKKDNSSYDGLVKAAELMPDNTKVQKALKAVNRKNSDINVGNLVDAVDTVLIREFGSAQSIDTLNDIKSKYGDNNGYVNEFYAREYKRITGEDYSPSDTSVLQSDARSEQTNVDEAAPMSVAEKAIPYSRTDDGIVYKAKTAEGMAISEDMEMVDRLLEMFTRGMQEVRDNYDAYVRGEYEGVNDSVKAQRHGSAEDESRYSEYDKPITLEDVGSLRSIISLS